MAQPCEGHEFHISIVVVAKQGQVQVVQYRREIDGLRAVAVLPVIWFHTGFFGLSGGFLGVDVFFVISGFLITGILLNEIEGGTFSILGFYERRARRILPALFVVVLTTIPFAWFLLDPPAFADYSRSIASVMLFISNVHFWENVNYFGLNVEQMPLLHTWSLAVEEQFYLVFPLVLLLFRRISWVLTVTLLGILAALSLALSEWGWRNEPDVNFFFTFSRFWELFAGAIAAVVAKYGALKGNGILAMLGLVLILGSMMVLDEATPVPSLYALAPVLGSVLVLLFAQGGAFVARLLSLRWLVGVGLISYSAYLWHYPLFAFAHVAYPNGLHPGLMLVLLVLTLVLAGLTWIYVEQPFRRRTERILSRRGSLFAVFGVIGAVFFAFGVVGDLKDGFVWRFYTPALETLRLRDSYLREEAERRGVKFISFLDALCDGDGCLATVPNSGQTGFEPLIYDSDHLTRSGSEYLAEIILKGHLED